LTQRKQNGRQVVAFKCIDHDVKLYTVYIPVYIYIYIQTLQSRLA